MKTLIRLTCGMLAVLMLGGCSLFTSRKAQNTPTAPEGYYIYTGEEDLFRGGKLDELMALCEERYIGEADRTAMEDAAAAAIIEALGDRWSYYIPASSYQDYTEQMNNSYVGIGITIQVREDKAGFDIVAVEKGGPAYEAGICPGEGGDALQHFAGGFVGEGEQQNAPGSHAVLQ